MKHHFGVIHAIANCSDCDWQTQSYKNAQAIAAKHARHHKHKVFLEWAMGGFYDGH
jgi:hypothetical protein